MAVAPGARAERNVLTYELGETGGVLMALTDIEAILGDDRSLTPSQAQFIRASAMDKDLGVASRALELIRAYPALCHVSDADAPWLEKAVDRDDDAHLAAHALSLLCDWLGRSKTQEPRLLRALVSRTDGGDFLWASVPFATTPRPGTSPLNPRT